MHPPFRSPMTSTTQSLFLVLVALSSLFPCASPSSPLLQNPYLALSRCSSAAPPASASPKLHVAGQTLVSPPSLSAPTFLPLPLLCLRMYAPGSHFPHQSHSSRVLCVQVSRFPSDRPQGDPPGSCFPPGSPMSGSPSRAGQVSAGRSHILHDVPHMQRCRMSCSQSQLLSLSLRCVCVWYRRSQKVRLGPLQLWGGRCRPACDWQTGRVSPTCHGVPQPGHLTAPRLPHDLNCSSSSAAPSATWRIGHVLAETLDKRQITTTSGSRLWGLRGGGRDCCDCISHLHRHSWRIPFSPGRQARPNSTLPPSHQALLPTSRLSM